MTGLASIVIPVYNGMPFLPEAVASALAQDYRDLEVVVVENGSTDGTAEWLRGQGITVEESAGALSFAAAVNRGIRRARYAHT